MSRTKTSGLTKEIKIKRCYGCGAILQSDHKGQSGYILKSKLDSNEDQLCERCFKLRHYSEDDGVPHFNEDYATILKKAQEDQAWTCFEFLYANSLEEAILTKRDIAF